MYIFLNIVWRLYNETGFFWSVIILQQPTEGLLSFYNHLEICSVRNIYFLIFLALTIDYKNPLIYHHNHVVSLAQVSLTLSRHFSLSFIASFWSSGLYPVPSHSCCMYVLAGRPALARPYVGVHRSTSLMSSSLLPQQCPTCLARLTWIVFVMVAV